MVKVLGSGVGLRGKDLVVELEMRDWTAKVNEIVVILILLQSVVVVAGID
jgi:hypothetical protein